MVNLKRNILQSLAIMFTCLAVTAAAQEVKEANPPVDGNFDWRGYRVHYQRVGPRIHEATKATDAIILLHGFGTSTYTWRHNITWIGTSRRIYSIDLLGFGKSDKPEITYSPQVWANLVNEFMIARHIKKVSLIGHSLGGLVACRVALKFPEKLDRLVLVAPMGLRPVSQTPWRISLTPVLGSLLTRFAFDKEQVEESLREDLYFDPTLVGKNDVEAYWKPYSSAQARKVLAQVVRSSELWTLAGELDRIAVPTLIIWGDKDKMLDVAQAAAFHKQIPDAKFIILPACGHLPHEERPEDVNKGIRAFLGL